MRNTPDFQDVMAKLPTDDQVVILQAIKPTMSELSNLRTVSSGIQAAIDFWVVRLAKSERLMERAPDGTWRTWNAGVGTNPETVWTRVRAGNVDFPAGYLAIEYVDPTLVVAMLDEVDNKFLGASARRQVVAQMYGELVATMNLSDQTSRKANLLMQVRAARASAQVYDTATTDLVLDQASGGPDDWSVALGIVNGQYAWTDDPAVLKNPA